MDEWLKQLQTTLDLAAQNSSEWLVEVSQKADQAIEEWVDGSLEVAQEIDQAIAPTLTKLGEQVDSALDSGLVFFDEHVAPLGRRNHSATNPNGQSLATKPPDLRGLSQLSRR